MTADTFRTALMEATKRGLIMRRDPANPELCHVECAKCGWLKNAGFDVSIERYAAAPHGCGACEHRENLQIEAALRSEAEHRRKAARR